MNNNSTTKLIACLSASLTLLSVANSILPNKDLANPELSISLDFAQRNNIADFTDQVRRRLSTFQACPDNFTLYQDTCYFAGTEPVTFADCRGICSAMSSDMLCVQNATQDTFLTALMYMRDYSLWLGLTDEVVEGVYVWEGTCPSTYLNWNSLDPNGGTNENYVSKWIEEAGAWIDYDNNLLGVGSSVCGCETSAEITADFEPCPTGLIYFGSQCYFVDTVRSSYSNCKSQCSALGYDMLCVEDSEQDLFLSGLMLDVDRGFWIGYNDAQVEGNFKWEGTCISNFTNWGTSEPNNLNGNEHYAVKVSSPGGSFHGRWNDRPNSQNNFLLQGVPTTPVCACQTSALTPLPTANPTHSPSSSPSAVPTASPTAGPTAIPTSGPTVSPTAMPTLGPTASPTARPTAIPTSGPSASPTAAPTAMPTLGPTASPTAAPTVIPMSGPTASLTAAPTATPTMAPSAWQAHLGSHISDGPLSFAKNTFSEKFFVGFTRSHADGTSNTDDWDAFVRKFKAGSIVQDWKLHLGGPGHDIAYSVVTDSAGSAYVCGKTSQSLPGYTNVGGTDAFLSKLGRDGVESWHVQLGTAEDDSCFKVRINQDENMITLEVSSGNQQVQAFFAPDGNTYAGDH